MKSVKIKNNYPLYMLMPGVIIFAIFFVLPFFMSIRYSFTDWDFYKAKFIGFFNYKTILMDPNMNIAIKNTLLFTIVTSVGKVGLGMLLAVFLNQKLRTTKYSRTVFFLPAILNTVGVGILFTTILHPTNGMLNQFLNNIHLGFLAQDWLVNTKLAMLSISGIEIWKWTGFTMIIILAGLQSVSADYYESADIDGATNWTKFWKITFPLIIPAVNTAFVSSIIGGLKVFDIVSVTTGGGPGRTTEVLNTVIFESFGNNLQGLASAGNVVIFALVLFATVASYLFIKKREVEQ